MMTRASHQHRPPAAPRTAGAGRGDYDALVRRADTLRRAGDHTAALHAFHGIAKAYPQRSDAFSNLAGMLQATGNPVPALDAAATALRLDPKNLAALTNSAEILKDFAEWAAVLETYDAALQLAPASAELRFARGLQLLMMGQWADGWREHEQRWQVARMPLTAAQPTSPRWDGSPLHGRHLLLIEEQGLGDQIMFARFAPVVAAGGRVTVRCAESLRSLFAALPGVDSVITGNDPMPAHDIHASTMSLPFLLGLHSPEAVDGTPYLRPNGACPEAIGAMLPMETIRRPRIGLVWAGNPRHRNDARRSIPPHLLQPLVTTPGVNFFSLQHASDSLHTAAALPPHVTALGPALSTLNDTAHALRRLDLLITVDTSVAHLAGALGVPTLLLVPLVPDWRWLLHRSDTPWYGSVQLLRQSALFEWAPVIDAARSRVVHLIRTVACRNS
jgi:hypothetical protein